MNRRNRGLQDRLIWQCASLLLAYPDEGHQGRLTTAERLHSHVTGAPAALLAEGAARLRDCDPMRAAADYVETFDLRKRSTMYLTYWTAGDTRNRGMAMLTFAQAYRAAGATPPQGEAPDHLPVVLEFAATIDPDAGRRLLAAHRVPIDVLRRVLVDAASPYAPVLTALAGTLPAVGADESRQLLTAGPPAESVGLEPFQLTVPPRRTAEQHSVRTGR
jgi:nitrate reductase delta subunit